MDNPLSSSTTQPLSSTMSSSKKNFVLIACAVCTGWIGLLGLIAASTNDKWSAPFLPFASPTKKVAWTKHLPRVDKLDFEQVQEIWNSKPVNEGFVTKDPEEAFSAAILYLVSTRRIQETLASIETIARNMPLNRPYPIIFLHDGELSDSRELVSQLWNSRILEIREEGAQGEELAARMEILGEMIEYHYVDLSAPYEALHEGLDKLQPVFGDRWPGYHSMCRFFATGVFHHPRLKDLDYYMRMDTDSFIASPICYDPFELAHRDKLSYVSRAAGGDVPPVVVGMWDFVSTYADYHPESHERLKRNEMVIPKPEDRDEANFPSWYNNFEIVHLPSFKTPEVQDWLNHLRSNWKGFYSFRWGDAPLRFATTMMFFEPHQYRILKSFDYFHQFMIAATDKCEADWVPTTEEEFGDRDWSKIH